MASNSTFTVADGASTPVSFTFTPQGIEGMIKASWQCLTESLVSGRKLLALIRGKKPTPKTRSIQVKMTLPFVADQVVNGVTTRVVVSYGSGFAQFTLPDDWTEQQCKDMRVMMANALGTAHVAAAIDRDEFPY